MSKESYLVIIFIAVIFFVAYGYAYATGAVDSHGAATTSIMAMERSNN